MKTSFVDCTIYVGTIYWHILILANSTMFLV